MRKNLVGEIREIIYGRAKRVSWRSAGISSSRARNREASSGKRIKGSQAKFACIVSIHGRMLELEWKVAASLHNSGSVYESQGKLVDAESMYEKSLRMRASISEFIPFSAQKVLSIRNWKL